MSSKQLESKKRTRPKPNIVLFGECGVGKSSIINVIAQKDIAPVGNSATNGTLKNTCYSISFDGLDYSLYDTAGLDEANGGSVSKQQAITQLYRLLTSLDTGVNLLVFCIRAPRVKDSTYKNWRIFYEIICGGHVPIILAITGLEQEKDMGRWWHDNKGAFQKYGMHPNGVACITATRGINGYSVAEEYRKSQVEMHRQIKTCCLERAWKVPTIELFTKVTEVRYEMRWYGLASPIEHKTFRTEAAAGLRKLAMQCELSEKEALEWGEALSEKEAPEWDEALSKKEDPEWGED